MNLLELMAFATPECASAALLASFSREHDPGQSEQLGT